MADTPESQAALLLPHSFWAALSPTTVKQQIARILDAPDSAAVVQSLSPVEYTVLLKASPDMRALLLHLGQPEQIRTVLDIDCWHKDQLDSARVVAWLGDLRHSGDETFTQTVQALDRDMLSVALCRVIQVEAAPTMEEDLDPVPYDEVLANELYRVTFRDHDSPLNEQLVDFLRSLLLSDLDLYHGLMQDVMWTQESEMEEAAYRWKVGRLQDEGIPDYYEALETYHVVDVAQLHPAPSHLLEVPGIPVSAEETGLVPSYAWSLTPPGSLLARAVQGVSAPEVLERLCWEMVALCNKAMVLDQVDFAETATVRESLGRVHAQVNIGVEYLGAAQPQRVAALLHGYSLLTIAQVGFSLSMRLKQRAIRLDTHLSSTAGVRRALPSIARAVVDGLLQAWYPQFFVGLESPGETTYRDFLHLQDIERTDALLRTIEQDPAYHLAETAA